MKTSGSVLVMDDEEGICKLLKSELSNCGYKVVSAPNGKEGLRRLAHQSFQVALCDMRMPELDGMEMLSRMRTLYPDLQVIMMTGYASIQTAIEAMKKGAYDFIEKPFHLEEVTAAVNRAIAHQDMQAMLSVYELSRVVFDTMDLSELLSLMTRNVQRITVADEVSMLMRHDGQDWYSMVSPPSGPAEWEADHRTLAALVQSKFVMTRAPFLASAHVLSSVPGISSALLCPLHAEGDWQGLLLAVRRDPHAPFLPIDIRHATVFASFGTQAIRNARLYDQLIQRWKELDEAHHTLQDAQQNSIQKEKMAAIGQLATGVAHELNNPLTGIMGFSQMLASDPSLSLQQHEDAQTIYNESLRCKKIIDNLLQFSRRSTARPRNVDIRQVIHSAQELTLYEKMPHEITITSDVPEGFLVNADFAELQHLFLNLLTNARQALQDTKNPEIHITGRCVNGLISVQVADNGPGIAPDHLSKIFDPFFTTKPAGSGTGLGLSLCQNIAKAYAGRITVQSQPGATTVFTIEFPSAA